MDNEDVINPAHSEGTLLTTQELVELYSPTIW